MATASAAGGGNGFFSSITSTVGGAVSSLSSAASQILPVWSQVTAIKQQKNQLSNPTTNQQAIPPNLNGIGGYIKANPVSAAVMLAAAVLGAVLLFKLVRR